MVSIFLSDLVNTNDIWMMQSGGSLRFSLRAAALVMIAKVAELAGAAEYLVSSGPSTPVAYKRPPH